jgi:Flp pilus assembly protein TadD
MLIGRHRLRPYKISDRCLYFAISSLCVSCIGFPALAQTKCMAPDTLLQPVQTHPDVNSYTALGTWFGEHQQFECANRAFRAALKLEPNSAKLNYFLAFSLSSSGQLEAAIAPLQHSIQTDNKALQPRVLLASVLARLNRKDEAITQWKSVLAIDPASTDALDGLANLLTDSGNPQAAIDLLRHAQLNEDLAVDLARAYAIAGMQDDAISTIHQALATYPSSLRLTSALATVYVHQNRFQDAATIMRAYVEKHPDDTQAQIDLFRVLVLNKNSDEARPLGLKLLTAAPHDFDVVYLNGLLEVDAAEYAAARNHLSEAVKLHPNEYNPRFNLGVSLAHLNDPAGAKVQFEKAIAIAPSQPEGHFQLAAVLRALNHPAAAQEQLKLYQQLSKAREAESLAHTKSQMAAQKLDAGDAAQAVTLYQEAASATPDDALLHYKLAMALDQSGDTAGERSALEHAIKLDPTLALAQNQLGYLLARDGNQAAAEEHFRAAVKAAPEFAEAWVNLASTLGAEDRLNDAQQAIATALKLDPNNAHALEMNRQIAAASRH